MRGWTPGLPDDFTAGLPPLRPLHEKKEEKPLEIVQSWPFMIADEEDGHETITIITP